MVLKLRQLLKCHLAGILPYMSIAGYPSLRFIPGYQVGADLANTVKAFLQHLVYETGQLRSKQVHANQIPAGLMAQLMATCEIRLL